VYLRKNRAVGGKKSDGLCHWSIGNGDHKSREAASIGSGGPFVCGGNETARPKPVCPTARFFNKSLALGFFLL